MPYRRKKLEKDSGFDTFSYIVISIISLFSILPFWLMISASFTDEIAILKNGFTFFPSKISLDAYKLVFTDLSTVGNAYKVSIIVTIVGTVLGVLGMTMFAYPISLKDFKGKNFLSFYCFFTMIFSGGMAAEFILVRNTLKLTDTYWAMILPQMINVFWIFVLRNFFKAVPESIRESALIDGAHDWTIFTKIILPLAVPGIATVALFQMLFFWNEWYQAMMFIDARKMEPLPLLMYRIISDTNFAIEMAGTADLSSLSGNILPSEGVKMATSVVTIGPIIFIYPFIQKYFVKGITLGGVKG